MSFSGTFWRSDLYLEWSVLVSDRAPMSRARLQAASKLQLHTLFLSFLMHLQRGSLLLDFDANEQLSKEFLCFRADGGRPRQFLISSPHSKIAIIRAQVLRVDTGSLLAVRSWLATRRP